MTTSRTSSSYPSLWIGAQTADTDCRWLKQLKHFMAGAFCFIWSTIGLFARLSHATLDRRPSHYWACHFHGHHSPDDRSALPRPTWKSPPPAVLNCDSLSLSLSLSHFKSRLKTHLFLLISANCSTSRSTRASVADQEFRVTWQPSLRH